jgi:5-methylcytosine-specific restriction endonuclease McrA
MAQGTSAHCKSGLHEWTPSNTIIVKGKRRCRECVKARKRESYRRQTPPKCSVEDCPTLARKRGWCASHFGRWKTYGDPLAGPPIARAARTPAEKKQRQLDAAKRYRTSHAGQELERYRRYRQENWEQVKASLYRWRKENSATWHATVYRARLKRLDLLGPDVELVDREAILATFGMVCYLCAGEIESRADLEFDHVIPIVRGGGETWDNIRPSHMRCNRRKGAKLLP